MLVALPWLGAPAVPSGVLQPTAGSLSTAPPCASDATFLECIGAVVALDNSTSDRYVTIGAHTADEDFDPLYQTLRQTAWTGLLVEPEPHLYSILTSKQRPGFEYERVAVGAPDEAGKNITFYTVSDDIDPYTGVDKRSGKAFPTGVAGGINSLNRSHLLKHSYYWTERGLKIDDYIVPISVPCVAASWLLTKHELSAPSFRLLLVDTEGHDAKIVSSVDFTKYRPDFIMYEHMHLEAAENATALRRVLDAGYRSAFTDSWTSNLAFVRIV